MGALLKVLQTTHSKTVDAINALLKFEDIQVKKDKAAGSSDNDNIYDLLRKED